MARQRGWIHGWSPADHGIDADRDPQLAALQAALSLDPSVAKVWLGPEGPGRHKYMQSLGGP